MPRLQPPASLEVLRSLLDHASARRSFLTGMGAESDTGGRPMPSGTRSRVVIVAVDGDYVAAIIMDGARLDTPALADALGAKRAQLVSPQTVRKWLGAGDQAEGISLLCRFTAPQAR